MRIAVFPIGNLESPSTWYRIGQYLPHFQAAGIEVEFAPKDLDRFDLVLNQKNLFPKIIRHKRLLFDFDDALWTRPIKPYSFLTQWRVNRRLHRWLQGAETIVANEYLARYARQHCSNVSVIPMSLDLDHWKPGQPERGLIGWSGAPHNFHYLQKIEDDLLRLKADFPWITFAVYSGQKPNLKIPFEYVPFKKGEEPLFTQRLSIGLLPLDDDPYSFGKSPIKALQYMACGVPVVTNGKGATQELLQGEAEQVTHSWYESLSRMLTSPKKQNGRALAEAHHDIKKVSKKLIALLRDKSL